MRKTVPVARRVLYENNEITISLRKIYARALAADPKATLGDIRKAVTILEELQRTARRLLGGAHPDVARMERSLRNAQALLRAREASNA